MVWWAATNDEDPRITMAPNIFSFATKELSQDAVICWLIDWAGTDTTGSDEDDALRRCGRAFVDALFAKWPDWKVELGEEMRTEVLAQHANIDVLARVDSRHVLLIEDKTDTSAHHGQLDRYWDLVVDGKTPFGEVATDDLFPFYFKTGNHSLRDRQDAEKQEYAVFDRTDFLAVLDTYAGTNAILVDFRDHLRQWEQDTNSFRWWTKDTKDEERSDRGWEGLYRWIEESALLPDCGLGLVTSDREWGLLTTQVGGYWGVWIEPKEIGGFSLWLEKGRINFRLYGSVKEQNRDKEYWANALSECGGGRLDRPRRLVAAKTKPMCVAEWREWLAFGEDGRLDKDGTLQNLVEAKEIVQRALAAARG